MSLFDVANEPVRFKGAQAVPENTIDRIDIVDVQ